MTEPTQPTRHTDGATVWVWRHPRPRGAEGRCIGRTDLPVDPRRAKRLAHRIRQTARRHGLPRCVWTSHLQRAADVGSWLRRWGWQHRVDAGLAEMDFGRWDGLPWAAIPQQEIDVWCADFVQHRPGDGECLQALFQRVRAWPSGPAAADAPGAPWLVVSHGGWMLARSWLATGKPWPTRADQWPAAPGYGACLRLGAAAASIDPTNRGDGGPSAWPAA